MMKQRLFSLLFVLLLLIPVYALAAAGKLTPSDEPVAVSADRLEASETSNTLVFIGNAEARQGDITIYADRLTLIYSGQSKEVEKVHADGHVRIVQGQRVATGEHGVFFRLESRVVLTGQPKVSEGENFVEGHEIVLFLDDRSSIVKSGQDGRVNAVFHPKSEKKP